ncbi:MAG: N-acetyltransferase family protein [Granulosicoccus sp.]
MSQSSPVVTLASAENIPAMCEVYGYHVLHGTGSFEEVPPSVDEMHERWQQRESCNHPTLVVHQNGAFAGFAYAASHKQRSAYRYTVEDSIYVAPDFAGQGLGRVLLRTLIEICTERKFKQMIAVIGDSANRQSIGLHESCGFKHVGTASGIGYKFDRWLDIVYMQRSLG